MATRKKGVLSQKRHTNGKMTKYRSYLLRFRSPIVDAMSDAIADSDLKYAQISDLTRQDGDWGVASATVSRLRRRITRRPLYNTIEATAAALGKKGIRFNKGNPYLE